MDKYSYFLTDEERQSQLELANILYNGGGCEPLSQTESTVRQNKYRCAVGQEEEREFALDWINVMTNIEFQTRLIERTLPDFVREEYVIDTDLKISKPLLVRHTNHPYRFLTDEELYTGFISQGYIHRNRLRYFSIDDFIKEYYNNY